jgi:Ca-activated chloride channel family protein
MGPRVSFASPIWLAALALIPLAITAQLAARRRARRYTIRFPAVSTLRLALDAGGSWRRHVPAALALAALAALVLALARPRESYGAPVDEGSIMLVTDHSGSMASTDVSPTRLAAAERAANTFIDELPRNVRVGAIAFSTSPDAVQAPDANHAAARAIINAQSASGATATGSGLELALQLLHGANPKHPPSAIVLLSDGAANTGPDVVSVARQAAQEKIPIDTVALGTPNGTLQNPDPFAPAVAVPPDPLLMEQIAQASGGRSFNAQSADQLSSIYKRLGNELGTVTRKREVTADFAIGGLVLLVLAGLASTRWAGRLP